MKMTMILLSMAQNRFQATKLGKNPILTRHLRYSPYATAFTSTTSPSSPAVVGKRLKIAPAWVRIPPRVFSFNFNLNGIAA